MSLKVSEDDNLSSNGSANSDENNVNELWNVFYDLLETTLINNPKQQLSADEVRELINEFNRRRSSMILNNNNNNRRVSDSSLNSEMSSCSSVNFLYLRDFKKIYLKINFSIKSVKKF